MKTVAFITGQEKDIPPSLPFFEEEIAIHCCARYSKRICRKLRKRGINIAAIAPEIPAYNHHTSILLTRGHLLRLALLPQMLDMLCPHWQRQTIVINCRNYGNAMAAWVLAQETDLLLLNGCGSSKVKELLFDSWGCIPKENTDHIFLDQLDFPQKVLFRNIPLPLCLMEAALFALKIPSPTPGGIMELSGLAEKYHILPYCGENSSD